MRDGEDGPRRETIGDDVLHHLIRLQIHRRGGLVEAHHASVSQHRARQAEHLSLSRAEILAVLRHRAEQTDALFADRRLELHRLEGEPELLVAVLLERVEIVANVAAEQDGVLRDARDAAAKVAQGEGTDIHAIEPHAPAARLHEAPHGDDEGRLSGTGATADAHLLAGLDVKGYPSEDERKARAIAQLELIETDGSGRRPVRRRCLHAALDHRAGRFLGLESGVFRHALHGHHVALELGDDANEPRQQTSHVNGVRERQTH